TTEAIKEPGVVVPPIVPDGEPAEGSKSRPAKPKTIGGWILLGLKGVASLRLTVVLFALGIFLVFAGTVAQIDAGIWTTVSKYFRSFYVWIPFGIFFPRTATGDFVVRGGFPFPGGWLIGAVLLVNLLAAHAVRFKMTWQRSGILILHAGM